ncbi:pescadillo-like protein [Achlya hypogyna]|uniref:Pescadillo homolog n=1 Tax=Achlya hypogyna TaxID=1202772 RepID=A0A1V9ZJ44_ACHHY|nr:pescadillo-like protein [Achlya hypogyna]
MPTKRVKGKKKLKSIKAKQTDAHGSKRRLAKLGKEQRKGMKGTVANYITRSQAIKKLQITLKDFRRLCILKGIYPRDPKKKASGKATTYYYIKDVMHLAHEPILDKFREFKTFMKKLKKSLGRKDISEARRKNDNKPTYELDHIVKERYPRFQDALGDLDDALCLIHLFAVMPAIKGIKSNLTETCLRLVREWQNYVAVSRSLTKVFVSIKGIYYQAEVLGETITWLVPHTFTPTMDKHVDLRVMLTFLEFYEVLLKFVNFKLYTDMGIAYPPQIDLQLDGAGAQLAAMKLEKLEAAKSTTATSEEDASMSDEEDDAEANAAVVAQQQASESRIASLVVTAEADNDAEDEVANYGKMTESLEAAFASDKLAAQFVADTNAEESHHKLFDGLRFFLSREVPAACLEFVIRAQGGVVGWEGTGSPFSEKSDLVTHHIMDRPHQGHRYFTREYVQPQWIFDSVNNGTLLPLDKYVPGASLPPHLSPFVDDHAEGYVPDYRKQLDKLKSAIDVHAELAADDDEEEDESEDEEAAYAQGLKDEAEGKAEANSDDDDDDEESSSKKRPAPTTATKPSKKMKKQAEDEELHEMAVSMMNKKAKRLYSRMQHGIGKKSEAVKALEDKKKALDAAKKAAK